MCLEDECLFPLPLKPKIIDLIRFKDYRPNKFKICHVLISSKRYFIRVFHLKDVSKYSL